MAMPEATYVESSNTVTFALPEGCRSRLSSVTLKLSYEDEEGNRKTQQMKLSASASSAPTSETSRTFASDLLSSDYIAIASVNTTPANSTEAERDPFYYFSLVKIQVEDTCFCVPTYHISPILGDLLGRDMTILLDHSNKTPITLTNVQKSDFRALLKLLYPLSLESPGQLCKDEWISVLKITSQNVDGLPTPHSNKPRTMAIDHLAQSDIGLAELVQLGRKHAVAEWVDTNIQRLIQNEEPISKDMVERLGLETIENICREREQIYASWSAAVERQVAVEAKSEELTIVDQVFAQEVMIPPANSPNDDRVIEKIRTAHRLEEPTWLRLALAEAVSRERTLTAEEATKIASMDLSAKIWQARLEFRKKKPTPQPEYHDDHDYEYDDHGFGLFD